MYVYETNNCAVFLVNPVQLYDWKHFYVTNVFQIQSLPKQQILDSSKIRVCRQPF